MTPDEVKAVNGVLDACASDQDTDDWVADVAGATVAWEAAGSPRVPDVPSAEALEEAARLLVYRAKVLDGTAWGEASRELHEREASSARIVADFLRSLVRP